MGEEVGIIVLTELHPAGAAGCEHRHCAALCDPLEELICFFHDSEIGSNVHIEHLIAAESSDSSDHLALNVSTCGIAECFAECCSYGRSCEEYYLLIGICYSIPDLVGIVLLAESAYRTGNDTLTAAYAGNISELFLKCAADMSIEASSDSSDNAYALYIAAGSNASHAVDALVIVSDDISRRIIELISVVFRGELLLIRAVFSGKTLQFAEFASFAGKALLVVVGEKELESHLS